MSLPRNRMSGSHRRRNAAFDERWKTLRAPQRDTGSVYFQDLRGSNSRVSSVSRFAFRVQLAAFLAFCFSTRCVSDFGFRLNSLGGPKAACVSKVRFEKVFKTRKNIRVSFFSCVLRFEFAFRCVFKGCLRQKAARWVALCICVSTRAFLRFAFRRR